METTLCITKLNDDEFFASFSLPTTGIDLDQYLVWEIIEPENGEDYHFLFHPTFPTFAVCLIHAMHQLEDAGIEVIDIFTTV